MTGGDVIICVPAGICGRVVVVVAITTFAVLIVEIVGILGRVVITLCVILVGIVVAVAVVVVGTDCGTA